MGSTIKIFGNTDELSDYFIALLELRARETGLSRHFTWMLSGGNTPKLLFRQIAMACKESIDWNKVKIFWGDERCVGPEDEQSNFKMARENLLDPVGIPSSNIFRIEGENDPLNETARYSEIVYRHVNQNKGIPQADLVMLGLGEDGHTASIFPENISLFNSDRLFERSIHPQTQQARITATGRIINQAKLVIIVATGESKALKVAQIIDRTQGWEQLPAGRVQPENGELIWLLDPQAAERLIKSQAEYKKPG